MMKKIISIIIICVCLIYVLPMQDVEASNSKKAISAYKKFLKKESYTVDSGTYDMSNSSFTIKDLNNDKIKELILFPNVDAMCTYVIYSYYKGKVRCVESAGHAEIGYFNKKSVFISEWTISSTGIIVQYYKTYKNGKLKTIASHTNYEYFDPSMEDAYEVSGKTVSAKKFKKILKRKYKLSKPAKYKYIKAKQRHTVTKTNIKKFVK